MWWAILLRRFHMREKWPKSLLFAHRSMIWSLLLSEARYVAQARLQSGLLLLFPFAFDKSALEIPYLLHRYSYWIAPIISSANISGKAPITIAKRVKNTAAGDHLSRQVSHLLSAIKILTKTTNAPKNNNLAMSHLSSCYHSQESGQPELTIQNSSAMNFANWGVMRLDKILYIPASIFISPSWQINIWSISKQCISIGRKNVAYCESPSCKRSLTPTIREIFSASFGEQIPPVSLPSDAASAMKLGLFSQKV